MRVSVVPLAGVVESVDYGITASAKTHRVGPRFLRITDIQDDAVDWNSVPFCEISPDEEEPAVLAAGDIVFARTRATTGKSFLIRSCPERAVFASYLIRVRADPDRVEPRYLAWFFRSPGYWRQIGLSTTGTAQPGVNASKLRSINVPHFPVAEQRRIADILDKADAVRRKRREAIALTEELLRSAFLEMFGDPVTNPMGWPVRPLGMLGELDRGRSRHRPRDDPRLLNGPHPLIQTGEVANCDGVISRYERTYSEVGLMQSKMWPAGTLCITIAANIAKTGVLGFDACFPDSVVGFTPGEHVTTEYVQYWMSFLQPILEKQAPQSAQKNINLEILRNVTTPCPPLDRQRRFSALVHDTREVRARLREAGGGAEALFDCLVARAFSGGLVA